MSTLHLPVDIPPDIFCQLGPNILLASTTLKTTDTIEVNTLRVYEDLNSAVGKLINQDRIQVGFAIHVKNARYINYRTGLIVYNPSWSASKDRQPLTNEEIKQIFPSSSDMYVFHSPDKFLVATTPNLSDRLHNFLTMV